MLALASLGAAGCGGKGERLTPNVASSEDGGVTVDPCNLTATLDVHQFGCTPGLTAKCLDFEGYPAGNGSMPTGWFAYIDKIALNPEFINPRDGTIIASDLSSSSDTYVRMTESDKHCGSSTDTVAYHMLSKGQDVWGPQFGAKFTGQSDGPLPPVNLDNFAGTNWEGMGFWIKKGNDHPELEPTGTSLFVSLRDPQTISSDSDTLPPCNDKSNFDNKKCDAYGSGVGFNTEWRFVMLPFDNMKQRGYGVPVNELDRTKILNLYFSMDIGDGANGNWNVWIDDVMLYKYK